MCLLILPKYNTFQHSIIILFLQSINIKINYFMGCSVCNNNTVYTPIQVHQYKMIQLSRKLKSNPRVKNQQLNEVKKRLLQYISFTQIQIPIVELSSLKTEQSKQLITKETLLQWKILALCRGNNFYQDNFYGKHEKFDHYCFDQIEKDISRTFVSYFNNENKKKLKRILSNIGLYFPQTGYTQGMNFVVGFFILCGFQEEDIFWIFVHLSLNSNYLFIGLFEDEFPVVRLYSKIFHKKLKQINIQVSNKLGSLGIPDEAWLFQWILTYYLYTLDINKCIKVWNFLLKTSGLGTVSIALAIIEKLFNQIIDLQLDYEIYSIFKAQKINQQINIDQILARAGDIQLNYDCFQESELDGKVLQYKKIFKNQDTSYAQYIENHRRNRQNYFHQQIASGK